MKKIASLCLLLGLMNIVQAQLTVPKGATVNGHGQTLLDTSAAKAKCVADSSVTGGYRMSLRWLEWAIYTVPNGKTSIGAVQVCHWKCKGGKHTHAAECIEGGCYTKCTDKHLVTLDSSRSTEDTVSTAVASESAIEHCIEVSAEAGIEIGPVSLGGSVTGSKTTSQTKSIENSISAAIGASQTGTVNIDVEHFNTVCCTKTTRVYGFYQYEVHVVALVKEHDYYADSWIIGLGKAGVLPSGGLKLIGDSRVVAGPSDTIVATYQIPSNEPLSEKPETICKCVPAPVTTPNGSGSSGGSKDPLDDQGSLPRGTSRFKVTPKDDEEYVVRNPYNGPLLVDYGPFKTVLEPKGEVTIPKGKDTSVVVKNSKGEPLLGILIDYGYNFLTRNGNPPMRSPGPTDSTPPMIMPIEGGAVNFGGLTPVNLTGPNLGLPKFNGQFEGIKFSGLTSGCLPVMGSSTPILEFVGHWPKGSQLQITEGTKASGAQCMFEVRKGNEVVRSFGRFTGVQGMSNPTINVVNPSGQVIGSTKMSTDPVGFETKISPESGKVGTEATMTVNCQPVQAVLSLDGTEAQNSLRLVFDYSNSGGATGPKTANVPANGIVTVKIKRGEVGEYAVGVGMEIR
ncbi:MAG: hypothetical protein JNK63_03640 [Chthonomonas sp.]|nr:hypothetical protein [Chthonomonas sp.]